MGIRKRRKENFFSEHTKCCFCGGNTPAFEQDHIPSRAIFEDRQWPEGFAFPACSSCNRLSSRPEVIISFLSRVHAIDENEKHAFDIEKALMAVDDKYPSLVKEMKLSSRQSRDAAKRYGLKKTEGTTYSELPLLSLASPIIDEAVTIFGVKLMLALYYRHLGAPLPATGGIAIKWYTNLQIFNEEIPEQVMASLIRFSVTKRGKTNLQDQFFYKYGLSENHGAGFVTVFRRSFAIVGIVKKDISQSDFSGSITLYQPFKPSEGGLKSALT